MRLNRLITHSAVALGLSVAIVAGTSGRDVPPPSPVVGFHERCVGAMAPALKLSPEQPTPGDDSLRRLTKLRCASAFRRLEFMTQRVGCQQEPPEKLLPILKDFGESRLELCDDPSALIPVVEARLGLARLIERLKECEAEVGRGGKHSLEDARYDRLDAEVQLARASAALKSPQRNRTTMIP